MPYNLTIQSKYIILTNAHSTSYESRKIKNFLPYQTTNYCNISSVSYQQLCNEMFLAKRGQVKWGVMFLWWKCQESAPCPKPLKTCKKWSIFLYFLITEQGTDIKSDSQAVIVLVLDYSQPLPLSNILRWRPVLARIFPCTQRSSKSTRKQRAVNNLFSLFSMRFMKTKHPL